MCDADGSEFWSYDPMGREKAEQRTTNSTTKTTGYTYDLNGGLRTLTYPSGRTITYVTDSAGRPSSAEDVPNNIFYTQGTCTNGVSSLGACYAPQGAIASANIGPTGGSTWLNLAISYTNRLQPSRIQYYNQTGSLMLLQYNFVDASSHNNGNVMGITNLVDSTRSQQFTYDQLNRLLTAETTSTYSTSPTHCWGEAYVYDNSTTTPGEFGNLTNINVPSTAYNGCQIESSLSLVANAANQITTFSYDASGNTLNDTHNSYTWNAESEIQTAPGVTYTYDGDGDRLQKSSSKIYWYGAGTEILDESDSSGNITDEYVYFGGKRVAHRVVSGNSIYYYGEDFLGTSRQIFTSASAICYDADFYPFGGERAYTTTCTPTYKFEGKERDAETSNDDFGARYYSSSFGRWTSPDWSAIPAPVPYANLTNPQTLNLYAMVRDNPETFADLDGHYVPKQDYTIDWVKRAKQEAQLNGDHHVKAACGFLCGLGQRIRNVFTGYGFKTNEQLKGTVTTTTGPSTIHEPSPTVTASTDVAGLILAVGDYAKPGGVIAIISLVNDHGAQNIGMTGAGLFPELGFPMAFVGAEADLLSVEEQHAGEQMIQAIPADTANVNGQTQRIPDENDMIFH